MNFAGFVGNMTRDPELKIISNSNKVLAKFGIAVNNWRGEPMFMDVEVWSNGGEKCRAEFVCEHFQKGKPISLTGQIAMDSYETKDGRKVTKHKLVADPYSINFVGKKEN